jgi:hypothetical protein
MVFIQKRQLTLSILGMYIHQNIIHLQLKQSKTLGLLIIMHPWTWYMSQFLIHLVQFCLWGFHPVFAIHSLTSTFITSPRLMAHMLMLSGFIAPLVTLTRHVAWTYLALVRQNCPILRHPGLAPKGVKFM